MSDTVIRIEGLGKKYRIGVEEKKPQGILRSTFALAMSPFSYLRRMLRPPTEEEILWAIRDISFEIQQGEVVGLIGRNGAGKSTLLKVLSRITKPTEGRAEIYGRVGSLLEVGTGFHPELTGRENIYLNGTILGMKKNEIDQNFDEIVAFSEVEKFLDTPVKRYSSGMYVRLAFAVAAHLNPEVLLVDEVLAVGDAAFQKKCLGKIGSIADGGRTVLFVSHNMAAIGNLCPRSVLLRDGRLVMDGETEAVIREYMKQAIDASGCWYLTGPLPEDGPVRITSIKFTDLQDEPLDFLPMGGSFKIKTSYHVDEGVTLPSISFVVRFKTQIGVELLRLSNTPISGFPISDLTGRGTIELTIPRMPFVGGDYTVDIGIGRRRQGFYVELNDIVALTVLNNDVYDSGDTRSKGLVKIPHLWSHRPGDGPNRQSGLIGPDFLLSREDVQEIL